MNGIVGRPAGIIESYAYSKGMRAFAKNGAAWDRALVLDYLESFAVYRP